MDIIFKHRICTQYFNLLCQFILKLFSWFYSIQNSFAFLQVHFLSDSLSKLMKWNTIPNDLLYNYSVKGKRCESPAPNLCHGLHLLVLRCKLYQKQWWYYIFQHFMMIFFFYLLSSFFILRISFSNFKSFTIISPHLMFFYSCLWKNLSITVFSPQRLLIRNTHMNKTKRVYLKN